MTAFRVDTSWRWAIITGRLGQQHRDILDAARMVAEFEEWTSDGRLHLKVDQAKLRAAVGGASSSYPYIKQCLEEMRIARVELHVNKPDCTIFGGIISEVADAKAETPPGTRPGAFDEGRRYWRISFSTGWSKLILDDLETKYPIRQITALRYGFSQAVARFCFSHTTVNDTVHGLMEKLNAVGRTRDRAQELHEDRYVLSELGVEVNGQMVKKRDHIPGEKAAAHPRRDHIPGGSDDIPGDRDHIPG